MKTSLVRNRLFLTLPPSEYDCDLAGTHSQDFVVTQLNVLCVVFRGQQILHAAKVTCIR